jgi:hypothetical protein
LADPGLQQTADSNGYFVDLAANQNQTAKISNSYLPYRNIIDGMVVFASNPINPPIHWYGLASYRKCTIVAMGGRNGQQSKEKTK